MSVITTVPSSLAEKIGVFSYGNIVGVTALTLNSSSVLAGFDISGITALQTVSIPNLVSVDPTNSQGGYVFFATLAALTSFTVPLLETVAGGFTIQNCNALTSLSFPALESAELTLQNNTSLTSITLANWEPTDGEDVTMGGNALSAASVNHILARCVANAGYANGIVDLSGGTNAAPTGQGATDVTTLTGRGVTVNTN